MKIKNINFNKMKKPTFALAIGTSIVGIALTVSKVKSNAKKIKNQDCKFEKTLTEESIEETKILEEPIEKVKTVEESREEMTYQEKIECIKLKRQMLTKEIAKNRSLIKELDIVLKQSTEENIELINKTMDKILNNIDEDKKEDVEEDKPYVVIRKRGQRYPNLPMGRVQIYDTTGNDILEDTRREKPYVHIIKL
ncbi:MAG: hypothetical protein E7170_03780 [Firmicutes bacterium]|nr:hypothetical protein [Bacillota bacterium]